MKSAKLRRSATTASCPRRDGKQSKVVDMALAHPTRVRHGSFAFTEHGGLVHVFAWCSRPALQARLWSSRGGRG